MDLVIKSGQQLEDIDYGIKFDPIEIFVELNQFFSIKNVSLQVKTLLKCLMFTSKDSKAVKERKTTKMQNLEYW